MLFERALGLWRGPAYDGIGDVAMVADEARRLEEERLLTCEELAVVDLARGRHAELVTGLTEMAGLHPYRERLQACLMLALSRAGRQAEALRVYQRTRTALGEELGRMLRRALWGSADTGCRWRRPPGSRCPPARRRRPRWGGSLGLAAMLIPLGANGLAEGISSVTGRAAPRGETGQFYV